MFADCKVRMWWEKRNACWREASFFRKRRELSDLSCEKASIELWKTVDWDVKKDRKVERSKEFIWIIKLSRILIVNLYSLLCLITSILIK